LSIPQALLVIAQVRKQVKMFFIIDIMQLVFKIAKIIQLCHQGIDFFED